MKLTILLIFILKIWTTLAHNILGLFPHPGFSHFKIFYPILNRLAENGHNVVVVSSIRAPTKYHFNYHEIIIEINRTENFNDNNESNNDESIVGRPEGVNVFDIKRLQPSRSLQAMFNEFWLLEREGKRSCTHLYNETYTKQIFNLHAQNSFDMVILEMFNTDCHLGIAHKINAPVIALSSCVMMPWIYDRFALPDYPSYIPTEFVGFSFEMNFQERFINYIITKGVKILYRFFVELDDNRLIREKLGIDVDVGEIAKQTDLLLVNQHYTLSGPRPLSPKVIEIGGVHLIGQNKTSKWPKDLENFINESEHGVILFSWGSLVKSSTLNKEKVDAIINALNKFPQRIIWKWENKEVPTKNQKFFFSKWIPQEVILCHPKVRLFWSHGGLLGVTEATHCGVPLIITPFYGDQFLNGKLVENRGTGKILNIEDITEEKISKIVKEVLNPSFLTNAKFLSKMFNERQNAPLETAIWHIENILNNPRSNELRYSPAVELNWFTYNSYDVILTLLVLILILLVCFVLLIKCIYNVVGKKIVHSSVDKTKKQS